MAECHLNSAGFLLSFECVREVRVSRHCESAAVTLVWGKGGDKRRFFSLLMSE